MPKRNRWLLRSRSNDDRISNEMFCPEHRKLAAGKGEIMVYTDFGERDALEGVTLSQAVFEEGVEEEEDGGGVVPKRLRNKGMKPTGGKKKKSQKELLERAAKQRKLKRARNAASRFVETEADLADEDRDLYGDDEDEDDSMGSLADFINDTSDVGSFRDR